MAATDDEMAEAAEDSLVSGVVEYEIRGRRVKRADPDKQLKTLLTLRGLQSSKRGLNVGQIDNDR
jgi:hypothetical protein